MARIEVTVSGAGERGFAEVTVHDRATTRHRVTVTQEHLARYGATDAEDLVRRSFEFLLAREPNTSILREFSLDVIERYFPEYREKIRE